MKRVLIPAIAATAIVLVGLALAQPPAGQPGGGGRGGRMFGPEMYQQLDLTAEQQKKIDEINAQYQPKIQEAQTPEARREVFTKMREEINAVLTEAQRAKMAELRGARRGPGDQPGQPPVPPDAGQGGGRGPGGPFGQQGQGAAGASKGKDAAEQKIIDVLDDMNRNQRQGMMNVDPLDGKLLRIFTESVDAKKVVEIGTSNGYSGIWFCLALRKTGGKLITHDIDEGRAKLARENFRRAGVDGIVTLVMGDAHETVKKLEGPIDVLFIDADKEGYGDYLKQLLPKVRPGGLILAHNTAMRDSMGGFIDAISTNPELETLFLNPAGQGMSVSLKKR